MNIRILQHDLPLPDLLDDNGIIKRVSTSDLDAIPRDSLRLWCHHHGRYGLVTTELVDWLSGFLKGRKAIEIGAGAGDLAHHLGIVATDSKLQERPEIAAYYRVLGQPVIRYPTWVKKYDALGAIAKFRPEVVIASWVTHWIDPNRPPPAGGGSAFGIKEDQIIKSGVTYVLIGSTKIHQHKPILQQPHVEMAMPFIRSRVEDHENRIFIWN